MEITPEIKAKIYNQYTGADCVITPYEIQHKAKFFGCSFSPNFIYAQTGRDYAPSKYSIEKVKFKLLLCPLSAISDEDAIEVAKLFGIKNKVRRDKSIKTCFKFTIDGCTGFIKFEFNEVYYYDGVSVEGDTTQSLKVYQYLQSKGYDLPHYLLSGKTLHEAGLAIYSAELN